MTTARDIIAAALDKIGVYAAGEPINSGDEVQALFVLNDLVAKWRQEYLYLYTASPLSLTFPMGGVTGLTIGIGGVFNQARPTRIDLGPGAASATPLSGGTTTPVDIVSAVEWEAFFGILPGTGTPNKLFYDPQYPLGVLNIAPTPSASFVIAFNAWVPFVSFATLATAYSFVTGTVDALKNNLSIALKPYYNEAAVNEAVAALAGESKAALRATNLLSRAMLPATRA